MSLSARPWLLSPRRDTFLGVPESVFREGSVRREDLPRIWLHCSVGWDFGVNETGERC